MLLAMISIATPSSNAVKNVVLPFPTLCRLYVCSICWVRGMASLLPDFRCCQFLQQATAALFCRYGRQKL